MKTNIKKRDEINFSGSEMLKKNKNLKERIVLELVKNKYVYIMAAPVILYFIIFCYLPMFGIVIAFKQYDVVSGIFGSPWVGFKHFKEFFESMYFGRVMKNTLLISIYGIVFTFPAPIVFALLLNELRNVRFKKAVQTITYLPHFISMVVICGMISDFFSTRGVITEFLTLFGGKNINYLGDAKYFRTIFIGTNLWQGLGWSSIIYLAALSSIDQQLYEAAEIDGAGRFRKIWYITLPGIIPTITMLFIMSLGSIMSVGYEKIILLYNPGTYETADVISSYVYRLGLGTSQKYSYTTAVGLFQSIVNLILLCTANYITKKMNGESLF